MSITIRRVQALLSKDLTITGDQTYTGAVDFSGASSVTFLGGTFTPTITFSTVGDLSVSYTTRTGRYTKVGDRVDFNISLDFTPTFTTATGNFRVAGLPFTCDANIFAPCAYGSGGGGDAPNFGAGNTMIAPRVQGGQSYVQMYGVQSNAGVTALTDSNVTTGVNRAFQIQGTYFV